MKSAHKLAKTAKLFVPGLTAYLVLVTVTILPFAAQQISLHGTLRVEERRNVISTLTSFDNAYHIQQALLRFHAKHPEQHSRGMSPEFCDDYATSHTQERGTGWDVVYPAFRDGLLVQALSTRGVIEASIKHGGLLTAIASTSVLFTILARTDPPYRQT